MTASQSATLARGVGRGLLCGLVLGLALAASPWGQVAKVADRPAAYLIPKVAGGTPLSLAMVHDVLHERFVRHSDAYYQARVAEARKTIAREKERANAEEGLTEPTNFQLEAMNNWAAALDRLHRSDEAVEVIRKKLALQQQKLDQVGISSAPSSSTAKRTRLSDEDYELYRSYANLGTFLIHAAIPQIQGDRTAAVAQLKEGLEWLKQAVALNPDAHFGRETWQIVIVQFVIAALENPELLLQSDFLGNALDSDGPSARQTTTTEDWPAAWNGYRQRTSLSVLRNDADSLAIQSLRREIRARYITRLQASSPHWNGIGLAMSSGNKTRETAVPFDEPTLGIVGMWTMGGGANPHFAIALAGVMERVGEFQLAWLAYERAHDLADRLKLFGNTIPPRFQQLCRTRQTRLIATYRTINPGVSEDASDLADRWRAEHQAELKRGKEFQKALAAFEVERLQERDVPGPIREDRQDFYRPFHQTHGKIASSTTRDWQTSPPGFRQVAAHRGAIVLLSLGVCSFLGGLGARLGSRRQNTFPR